MVLAKRRKIANAPVSWGILEVGDWGDTPYESFLEQLHELGYKGTELGPFGYFPTNSQKLVSELKQENLELVGAFVPVSFASWDTTEQSRVTELFRYLKEANCQTVLLSDSGAPGRRGLEEKFSLDTAFTEAEWEIFAKALAALQTEGEALGLRVMFHHHVGSFIETPEEIGRMLEITEPIGIDLCLDTGHLRWAGGDILSFIQKHRHRIGHLHLKDIHETRLLEARKNHLDFVSAVQSGMFVPLGEGTTDFHAVFSVLDEIGYDGWIVVEQDRLGEDRTGDALSPYEAARRSRAFLKEHFESL